MNRVHKLLLWFAMLSKRLYKKPTFLVIMVLIPLLVLGYAAISQGESGVITVGLAAHDDDPITQEIFYELQNGSDLLAFQICADPMEAETLLRGGKLDCVWTFPENMAERIERFVQQPTSSNAFITVLEREDNVVLMLSREKLNGAVYPYIAQLVYVHFLRNLAPELSNLSDEQLLEYYHATNLSIDLFDFNGATAHHKNTSYLISPLRGLLGTLILLCSLAAGMYFIRDMDSGTFSLVSQRWMFFPELGCQLVSTLHVAAISLISLALCGLARNFWTEVIILMMYSLCCSVFAMAMRQLCISIKVMSTILPLMIVLVLVICPVFFDLGALRQLQYLLPPTYYINAAYDIHYLLYMAMYIAVTITVTVLLQYGKNRICSH